MGCVGTTTTHMCIHGTHVFVRRISGQIRCHKFGGQPRRRSAHPPLPTSQRRAGAWALGSKRLLPAPRPCHLASSGLSINDGGWRNPSKRISTLRFILKSTAAKVEMSAAARLARERVDRGSFCTSRDITSSRPSDFQDPRPRHFSDRLGWTSEGNQSDPPREAQRRSAPRWLITILSIEAWSTLP